MTANKSINEINSANLKNDNYLMEDNLIKEELKSRDIKKYQ